MIDFNSPNEKKKKEHSKKYLNHHHQMSNYLCPTSVIKERIDLVKNRDGVKFLAYLLELKPLQGKKAIQIATQ